MSTPQRLLRWLLRANALFSGLCGLVFASSAQTMSVLTGRPSAELLTLGVGLLGFSLFLGWLSVRRSLTARWTKALVSLVVVLDVLWAVQTIVQVAGLLPYTPTGRWLFGALAIIVLGLTDAQGYALWRVHTATGRMSEPQLDPENV